jgi:plastocyanin
MRGLVAIGSVAALLLLAPRAEAAPQKHVVVIDKMKFGPVPGRIQAGDTIVWINRDMFRHTATATNGAFNIDLPAGAKGETIVRQAGAISVICKYHPGMRGVLKVVK